MSTEKSQRQVEQLSFPFHQSPTIGEKATEGQREVTLAITGLDGKVRRVRFRTEAAGLTGNNTLSDIKIAALGLLKQEHDASNRS